MEDRRLEWSLLLLRLTVFLVMLMWTLDKFVNPQHAAGVFSNFYGIEGLTAAASYTLGALELIVIVGFVLGLLKAWTYGIVLVLHAISTLSSYAQYFNPFEGNLLFFAAWPMLAACVALFLLRDQDRLGTVSSK